MEWDGISQDAAGRQEGRLGCERREGQTKAKPLARPSARVSRWTDGV